jgi:outer membrane protein assembly factor BamD (BamD/ComL family)
MPLALVAIDSGHAPDAGESPRATRRVRLAGLTVAILALMPGLGCQSTGANPFSVWRTALDSSLSPAPSAEEVGDDRNLLARWLNPKNPKAKDPNTPTLVLGSNGWRPMKPVDDPAAEADFKAAEALAKQNKLPEAATAYKAVAKKWKGTAAGEKAQFFLAEAEYKQGRFFAANDAYEQLMADYPGTELNSRVVKREYEIAQVWFDQIDPKVPSEKKLPWTARFASKTPLIDTQGYALKALEHVRHHNPQGELADDAVLKIADTHMANRDYDSAALYYDQLITDHPKSPFIHRAYLSSIDARLKGYLGPEYDGTGLKKARELIHQTMANFPNDTEGNAKLYHLIDVINDQEAERTFVVGQYYKKTGKVSGAEYYFGKIPQVWPKSPWAVKAKTELASLAKQPRSKTDPSKIMTLPGSTDPFSGGGNGMGGMGMPGMGGMGGMGMGGMGMPGMGGMN